MNIRKIQIGHFKSLFDVSVEPGNFNVIIGSNGSGKTALLEGIGILSAAIYERVNDAALLYRGVRLGVPTLFKSSFKKAKERTLTIQMGIEWENDNGVWNYDIHLHNPNENPEPDWQFHSEILKLNEKKKIGRSNHTKKSEVDNYKSLFSFLYGTKDKRVEGAGELYEVFRNYGIYAPNTATLRGMLPDSSPRDPLGLYGGRLAEALSQLIKGESFGIISFGDLLDVLDWVDEIKIGKPSKEIISPSVSTMPQIIRFKDRYMRDKNNILTSYDASEGALYVLFLLTLAMHEKSPNLFAIDNFDQALNPRLAKTVTKLFSDIVLRTNRIVFVTTHNPLVLDGLNLQDSRVRLFSLGRDLNGFTKMERVEISKYMSEKESLSRL